MSIFVFISIYIYKLKFMSLFKGAGGTPWDQIIENEFENLSDRGAGHGGHLAEKYCFIPSYHGYRVAIFLLLLGNG